jgi:adenine-specific DNA-methyltransferase
MESKIQDLLKEIKKLKEENKKLKSRKKYGIVWEEEKKPEQVVLDCQKKLPILKEVKDKSKIKYENKPVNILIEGDNYHALQVLNYTHKGKIDLIYIDPPYNTKFEGFIYNDKLVDINDNYRHSKYLNHLNKRLLLSKNVLKRSGFLFISIGEDEFANLKLLCDEIFSEENYIGNIARLTKKGGNKGEFLKPKKDYILVYAKDINSLNKDSFGKITNGKKREWKEEIFEGKKRKYIRGDIPFRAKLDVRKNQRYYIETPDGHLMIPPGNIFPKIKKDGEMVIPESKNDKCWTWSQERYMKEKKKNRFLFLKSNNSPFLDENGNKSNWTIYKKVFEDEVEFNKEILIDFVDSFPNSLGTAELEELDIDFPYPKPSDLIKWIIEICTDDNSIILDFFAGSGTTGQAVMNSNKLKTNHRKFILCTNNENNICSEKTYPRIKKLIEGYDFKGIDRTILYENKLTASKIKSFDKIKEEIDEIKEEHKSKFDKIETKIDNNTIYLYGIKKVNGKKEGLGGNLKYFKTDFIDVDNVQNVSDKKKIDLTYQAGELIAIKEDVFEEVEKTEWWQIFKSKKKTVAIYFREDQEELEKLFEKLKKTKAVIYLFSWGKNELSGDDYNYPNIKIKDIPQPIIEVYKEINRL